MSPSPDACVLVTGAAGVLGTAIVDTFLGAGWTVLAGRHQRPLPTREGPVHGLDLDVRRDDHWQAAAAAVRAIGVPLRMVVHNAGVPAPGLLARLDPDGWDDAIQVMTRPLWSGTRALRAALVEGGGGHVLGIGSHAMRLGASGQAAYAAAKAAMVGCARALAAELAPDNIRVNVLLPGLLDGPMLQNLPNAEKSRRLATTLNGHANDPAEVARFALFLATTRGITGQVLALDARPLPWA